MIIYEKQQGKIVLSDQDFLAEGGEGRLYVQGDRVYKIYHHADHVIPMAKFDELQALDHPQIIRPLSLLTDAKQRPVGYTMQRAPSPVPMPQLFSTTFREQAGITADMSIDLIKAMQRIIAYIHQQGFLMVDGNEFNYMVDQRNWVTPYFIDVDSYQTPSFAATVIMPSIRDYTASAFTEMSDWFSFAIVACQLMIGIHPFKGRHADFKKGDFEARIKAGVSVFNPEVSYPSSVREFSLIPKPYYEWFIDLFEKGIRRPPPDGAMNIIPAHRRFEIRDGALVNFDVLKTYNDRLQAYKVFNGTPMALLNGSMYIGNVPYSLPRNTQAVVLLMDHTPLFLDIKDQNLIATKGNEQQPVQINMHASRLFAINNTVYAINGNKLMELRVQSISDRVVITPGNVIKIMPNAHNVFDGVISQRVMGKHFLVIPYKPGSMAQIAVPELNDYRIIDAKYEQGIALIKAANSNGRYDLLRLRFDEAHTRYVIDIQQDYDEQINFAVLDKGVVVQMIEDGKLEVYLNRIDSHDVRVIEDKQILMAYRLFNHGGRLAAYNGTRIIKLSLK